MQVRTEVTTEQKKAKRPKLKRSIISEYFREHMRVTTQPIEETPNREVFDQMMESIHGHETMMFCSDYPHWDFDSPLQALPKLHDELWDRVYYRNAAELYNLPPRKPEREG